MHFLIKCLVVAVDEVEVKTWVLLHLLSAITQKAPKQIQNDRCYAVRLGVKQNSVVTAWRKILSREG